MSRSLGTPPIQNCHTTKLMASGASTQLHNQNTIVNVNVSVRSTFVHHPTQKPNRTLHLRFLKKVPSEIPWVRTASKIQGSRADVRCSEVLFVKSQATKIWRRIWGGPVFRKILTDSQMFWHPKEKGLISKHAWGGVDCVKNDGYQQAMARVLGLEFKRFQNPYM